jgi:hypothetical protein
MPGWPRRRCQVDADATKAERADVDDEGAGCEGRHIVYRGPELLHLMITFRVEILHREAKWVKLHGTPIVNGKMINR